MFLSQRRPVFRAQIVEFGADGYLDTANPKAHTLPVYETPELNSRRNAAEPTVIRARSCALYKSAGQCPKRQKPN